MTKRKNRKLSGMVTVPIYCREDILGSIPWIALLPQLSTVSCSAYRSGRPMYALFKTRREERIGETDSELAVKRAIVNEKYACKLNAKYVYVHLNGEYRRYCTHHVYTYGLHSSEEENNRSEDWLTNYFVREWNPALLDRI